MTIADRLSPSRLTLKAVLCSAALALAPAAHAQFEPPTIARGPKLGSVVALPAPGAYTNTTGIMLRGPAGAQIHYTLDGSKPTEDSPLFDPAHLLFLNGVYKGDQGLTTGYTIRAVAVAKGHTDSNPATFGYTVARRDRTAYISEEVAPGVRMIRDSDNDKMYLVRGTRADALIDTGMGRGDLKRYVAQYNRGRRLFLILTHSHGDHIGQASQFIGDTETYVGAPDRDAVAEFLEHQGVARSVIERHLKPLRSGARIDLGDRSLEITMVPGHTPGSIAILDPANGDLFSGDTFGNNSPLPPDVMWMQWSNEPLDTYLAYVLMARERFAGRVREIFTGHNDHPLHGTVFLDNLEKAIQRGLDDGRNALIPSWRPAGGFQLIQGDPYTDPNWFGVNVNPATFLPAPPGEIARLDMLTVNGAVLTPEFRPDIHDYALTRVGNDQVQIAVRPSASRSRGLELDGRTISSGEVTSLDPGRHATIRVTSPDGEHGADYRLTWGQAGN